jgi:hypothetical protein
MVLNQQVVLIPISPTRFKASLSIEELMIRHHPSLRSNITRLIVSLSLFGLLVSSVPFVPALQARGLHELGPERDGGLPGYNPDLGGDDDQPTFRQQPSRRMIASVSDPMDCGPGGRYVEENQSFFSLVTSIARERVRALRVWLSLFR